MRSALSALTTSRDRGPSGPALVRLVTSEHDEYLSAFHGLGLSGFLLARAERPWKVERGRLASCVVEHGVDGAPWAARGTTATGTVTVAFPGSPDAELRVDGGGLCRDELHVWPGGSRVFVVSRRPADWFVVTLAASAGALPRLDGAPGGGPRPVRGEELDRLRALAASALRSCEASGAFGLAPEEAEALEEPLLAGIARLAARPRSSPRGGTPRIDRRPVLASVDALFDARPSEPLYVADLCAATGLPERTLRHILVEEYGTSPVRLLRNRRLCELRRRLREEGPGRLSLSHIAAAHGFRHMGTLAADYRRLFGELPSESRRAGLPPARPAAEPLSVHA